MSKEIIAPPNVHRARGYSHAIKVGNTIYVAGQVALDEEGRLVGAEDIVTQTERAYENLKRVLEAAGATMTDVVKMNMFCTDLDAFEKTGEVRRKYLAALRPVITLVQISKLAVPGGMIEIEAVAVVD